MLKVDSQYIEKDSHHYSKVLEGLGYSVPENELSAFINQLDIDKSGSVDLLLFIVIDLNR